MAKNTNLVAAKAAKNDEFYTRLEDIEQEMRWYAKHFRNKVVYCNCDDAGSQFWTYFHSNFTALDLKKLIATHYEPSGKPSYLITYEGGRDLELSFGKQQPLQSNGDFRSEECISFLHEADIVVTNPPWSLVRDFLALMELYNKKYVFIGNKNAPICKEIFPLVKNNRLWLGYGSPRKFITSDGLSGKVVNLSRWYTNLDIPKRHENLFLSEQFCARYTGHEKDYPKYDNYNAIEVSGMAMIPVDYSGVMGVPITFLDIYNPEQFEILQLCTSHGEKPKNLQNESCYLNGKWKYARILVRNKKPVGSNQNEP